MMKTASSAIFIVSPHFGIDGFYYLQKTSTTSGVLSPGEKISILRSLTIDKSVGNEFAGKTLCLPIHQRVFYH